MKSTQEYSRAHVQKRKTSSWL